jgi:hypothetical protein
MHFNVSPLILKHIICSLHDWALSRARNERLRIKRMFKMNKYVVTKRSLMMAVAFVITGLNMPASALSNTNTSTENPTVEQTLPLATDLPDKLSTVVGSLANDTDVKYYTFTAARGQRVLIKLLNYHPSTFLLLIEYKINDQ